MKLQIFILVFLVVFTNGLFNIKQTFNNKIEENLQSVKEEKFPDTVKENIQKVEDTLQEIKEENLQIINSASSFVSSSLNKLKDFDIEAEIRRRVAEKLDDIRKKYSSLIQNIKINANLNTYVDEVCKLIYENEKFSNISLPDTSSTFMKWFKIKLQKGILQGARTISRFDNCHASYEVMILLLHLQLKFDELQAAYDISFNFLNFEPTIRFKAYLSNFTVAAAVQVDSVNTNVVLDYLLLPTPVSLKATIEGTGYFNKVINKIISTFVYLFHKPILSYMQHSAKSIIQEAIDNIPRKNYTSLIIPSPDCYSFPITLTNSVIV